MTVPTSVDSQRPQFRVRLGAATAVAVFSYVAWLVLWTVGGVAVSLAAALSRRQPPSGLRFGDAWQWVFGIASALLIVTLLADWRHTRVLAVVWFSSLLGLAALSLIVIQFDWTVPLGVALGALLFAWITRIARRAA